MTNSTDQVSETIKFDQFVVHGGGQVFIEGGIQGLKLFGNKLHLESGAYLKADRVLINVTDLIIEELAVLDLNSAFVSIPNGDSKEYLI